MALMPTTSNYTSRILACELPVIFYTTGTWTRTRTSAGIYHMEIDAADQTGTLEVPISGIVSRYFRNTSDVGAPNPSRGLRLMGVTYNYAIGTASMDAHSADIIRVLYNAAGAPTVSTAVGGTLTPALATTFGTVTTTGLYRTQQTLPTPIFMNPTQEDETLFYVVTINATATSTYNSHAVSFNFQIVQ